jgi:hypothetical protein
VEPRTVSFVVKITVDDCVGEPDEIAWHGMVTHVPSGEKRYVKNLAEMEHYIAAHLERLGVPLEAVQRSRMTPQLPRSQQTGKAG